MIVTIDWSPFATALNSIMGQITGLAAVLVGGTITIALVFAGARAVISWGTRYVGGGIDLSDGGFGGNQFARNEEDLFVYSGSYDDDSELVGHPRDDGGQ